MSTRPPRCLTCDTLELTILTAYSKGFTWVYLHQDYLQRTNKVPLDFNTHTQTHFNDHWWFCIFKPMIHQLIGLSKATQLVSQFKISNFTAQMQWQRQHAMCLIRKHPVCWGDRQQISRTITLSFFFLKSREFQGTGVELAKEEENEVILLLKKPKEEESTWSLRSLPRPKYKYPPRWLIHCQQFLSGNDKKMAKNRIESPLLKY